MRATPRSVATVRGRPSSVPLPGCARPGDSGRTSGPQPRLPRGVSGLARILAPLPEREVLPVQDAEGGKPIARNGRACDSQVWPAARRNASPTVAVVVGRIERAPVNIDSAQRQLRPASVPTGRTTRSRRGVGAGSGPRPRRRRRTRTDGGPRPSRRAPRTATRRRRLPRPGGRRGPPATGTAACRPGRRRPPTRAPSRSRAASPPRPT